MLKNLVIIIISSFLLALPAGAANLTDAFGDPLEDMASNAGYQDSVEPAPFIGRIIRIALSFLGIIFFILMLYGGFLWMTAAGSEDQVGKAKRLIVAAVTGLLIVLISYAVSFFIIRELGRETLQQSQPEEVPEEGEGEDIIFT